MKPPRTLPCPDKPLPCPEKPKPDKPYEAMVLSCIDPRILNQVLYYMNVERKLNCRFSQFTIAGAAIAVVAPVFRHWRETFWDNLDSTIKLHGIKKVIAIDHRKCGAAKIAYGEDCCEDRNEETRVHKRALLEFKTEVERREKRIKEIVIGLMDLDGTIELF
jgi:carbonic anhydrase